MSEYEYPQQEEGDETEFGGELRTLRYSMHFEQLAHDQLRKIAEAKMTGDSALVYSTVQQLENILSIEAKERVRSRKAEFSITTSKWKSNGGMSTDPCSPAISNKPGSWLYNPNIMTTRYELIKDGDIDNIDDWKKVTERGGINWMSPTKEEGTEVDYDLWISSMVDELQLSNAAWRSMRKARILGRVPNRNKTPNPLRIPLTSITREEGYNPSKT